MKGRTRLAPEIHKLSGAYAKNPQRENKSAPTSNGIAPEMPEDFGPDEAAKWAELVADMRAMGILSSDSREIMVAYCVAYGGWMACRKLVKATGVVLGEKNEDGKVTWKRNPIAVEMHKYRDDMNSLLPQFGLTPSTRSRLVSFAANEDDPFEQWLAGRGAG